MLKIIETNLSIDLNNDIIDHQSRIIEVVSWNEYINEYLEEKTVLRVTFIGNLNGATIPKNSKVLNLVYDGVHVSCDIVREGVRTKKLAYKINK